MSLSTRNRAFSLGALLALLGGCGRSGPMLPELAPPVPDGLLLESVTGPATVRPGLYRVPVDATFRNDGLFPVSAIVPRLVFGDADARAAEFHYRQVTGVERYEVVHHV